MEYQAFNLVSNLIENWCGNFESAIMETDSFREIIEKVIEI